MDKWYAYKVIYHIALDFGGFNYINIFLVWKKINKNGTARKGMGFYSRGVYEHLLLGTKGITGIYRKPQLRDSTISDFFSRKTYEFNKKIEAFSCTEK